jgi:bifunctional non-homologous end joining protein LigD
MCIPTFRRTKGQGPARQEYSRWRRLLASVTGVDPRVRLSEHVDGGGLAFFAAAKRRGLEGIMAKDRRSTYLPGKRSMAWQKIKIRPEQELVVGGWAPGIGKAVELGALLVGLYVDGALRDRQLEVAAAADRVLEAALGLLVALLALELVARIPGVGRVATLAQPR